MTNSIELRLRYLERRAACSKCGQPLRPGNRSAASAGLGVGLTTVYLATLIIDDAEGEVDDLAEDLDEQLRDCELLIEQGSRIRQRLLEAIEAQSSSDAMAAGDRE